jgi:hypothetical protein
MVIEHIIAGYSIPHNEGAIPLTKEAYDVTNPQKRLTDFSKTITIPENKVVNQIFEHAFDVNIDLQTFNPNLKTSYQIIQDGVTAIDGYCQLRSISNVDGLINYEIQATGKIGNLFEKIRDKYLQDLDLTSLDHSWTQTNVIDSWTAAIGQGYVYPMINLGGRSRYSIWSTRDFKPAIYLKQYIDTILTEAGYTYDSTFLNSDLFKRLIVPYGSGKILLDNSFILCKEFNVQRTSQQFIDCQNFNDLTNSDSSRLLFNNDSSFSGFEKRVIADGGVVENLACAEAVFDFAEGYYNTCNEEYNVNDGVYTAINSFKMSFQGILDFDVIYNENPSASGPNTTFFLNNTTGGQNFQAYVNMYLVEKNGSVYSIKESIKVDFTDSAFNTILLPTPTTLSNVYSFTTGEIDVISGREYFLAIGEVVYESYVGLGTLQPSHLYYKNFTDFDFVLNADSTYGNKLLDTEIVVGDTIETRLVVPKEIKQSDLLSSVIKRFNLYIDNDPIDENNLIIETRDGFLTDERVNLDHMVDRSKDYNIKPLGALDAGRFIFKDQLDKDYHNDAYNKVNDEVYGQVIVDIENDFLNADKNISTIFAPTPLETIKGDNDRVISSIRFENENNEQVEATAKIRLLYWGGLLDTQKKWFLNVPGFGGVTNTQYPYAGHLDNPYNPTFDLNWFVPKQLYYDFSYGNKFTMSYSNNNVYNTYWKKFIEEITDKNSKILECFLALRPYDYNELNFRKNYYIDGSYWRLLKVTDFDANSQETTKCTFLRVEPKDAFVPEVKVVSGGIEDYADDTPVPTGDMFRSPNSNSGKQQDSLQFGDSVKGGTRSLVASDNIEQSIESVNALIVGSDYSKAFADNVTLINSPYTETNRPDEAYINGLFVEKLSSIVLPYDVLINLETELQVLPSLPDDEFYEVTRGYVRLVGNAPTGGTHKIDIVEDDESAHLLAEIPSAFFNTDNNTDLLDIIPHNTTPIHFGSGLKITTNSAMAFEEGTQLIINLVYRIIKL